MFSPLRNFGCTCSILGHPVLRNMGKGDHTLKGPFSHKDYTAFTRDMLSKYMLLKLSNSFSKLTVTIPFSLLRKDNF